ncbi:MAG TPA: hypothetical protein VLG37_01545 [Candidatus Saccharimonadales bacterium]|nr:hypothetical protein [Candidatus Saccharimonadales bacterium]
MAELATGLDTHPWSRPLLSREWLAPLRQEADLLFGWCLTIYPDSELAVSFLTPLESKALEALGTTAIANFQQGIEESSKQGRLSNIASGDIVIKTADLYMRGLSKNRGLKYKKSGLFVELCGDKTLEEVRNGILATLKDCTGLKQSGKFSCKLALGQSRKGEFISSQEAQPLAKHVPPTLSFSGY